MPAKIEVKPTTATLDQFSAERQCSRKGSTASSSCSTKRRSSAVALASRDVASSRPVGSSPKRRALNREAPM
jgi:hypothetical protein